MSNDLDGLVRAIGAFGAVRTIAAPQILAMNNQPATMRIGAVPGAAVAESDPLGVPATFALSITPQIGADGIVHMTVSPAYADEQRGRAARHMTEADSVMRVRGGDTVVIAGLIREWGDAAAAGGTSGSAGEPRMTPGAGRPVDADRRQCRQRAGRRSMTSASSSAAVSYARLMTRAREEYAMYEDYYGFVEKPFSLTPDPKYLYKSESHAQAFELLQYGIRRREGFVVVTGDIGTGKTTLCRAVLDQLDRKVFTALVLNPFIAEDDLLRLILQDFGVVSRDEIKRGRLAGVSRQELIETLNDFLLSLLPLRATALLIIDEAQNLPRPVLEHIRILSNLETDKEKLLQIILVGQLNLKDVLRTPELRQLDQRVSIRYNLKPLNGEETAAYVAHRLTIAGGGSVVTFTPKALQAVHRITAGIPRLINLVCDRALLAAYSERAQRVTPDMVRSGAASLDLAAPRPSMMGWLRTQAARIF